MSNSSGKEAGAVLYLVEELGDARLRCDQLVRYIDRAVQLVDKSPEKDHIFEVAGDLLRAIPETAFKLNKALQAVALAAGRIDYEELKQELRPEKVEELERVLKDVRIRHVQRRSEPMKPIQTIEALRKISKQITDTGTLPSAEIFNLVMALEGRSEDPTLLTKLASDFEVMAQALEKPPQGSAHPSRIGVASLLRQSLIPGAIRLPKASAAEDEVFSRYEEGKPADPTKNMDPEDAETWKDNTDEHGDKFKEASNSLSKDQTLELKTVVMALQKFIKNNDSKRMLAMALYALSRSLLSLNLETESEFVLKAANRVWHLSDNLWQAKLPAPVVVTASEEDVLSRYEEGKPADPTENMSDEDAKQWKLEHLKNKDNFKEASSPNPTKLFPAMKECVDDKLNSRIKVRKVQEMLQDVLEDASGAVFTDNYNDSEIKETRDDLSDLDRQIGQAYRSIERVEKKLKKQVKTARYEEGKPADPTENMSEEDAEVWKDNTDEYGDQFKVADQEEDSDDLFKEAATSMTSGDWYVQEFETRGETYFSAQELLKNGNWKGKMVRMGDSGRPEKPVTSTVTKADMRLWKEVDASKVPSAVRAKLAFGDA